MSDLLKRNIYPALIIACIFIFFKDTIIWLVGFWISDIRNITGLIILLGFLYSIYENRESFTTQISIRKENLFVLICFPLLIFDLYNQMTWRINILSLLSLFTIICVCIFLFDKNKTKHTSFLISSLLFLCAPLSYYFNILFGYSIRIIYAMGIQGILQLFYFEVSLVSTTLLTDNLYINIDTGCSGVSTFYTLTALSVFLCTIYKPKKLIYIATLIILPNIFFFLLNFFQILSLVYSNNIARLDGVESSHKIIKLTITISSIILTFYLHYFANKRSK